MLLQCNGFLRQQMPCSVWTGDQIPAHAEVFRRQLVAKTFNLLIQSYMLLYPALHLADGIWQFIHGMAHFHQLHHILRRLCDLRHQASEVRSSFVHLNSESPDKTLHQQGLSDLMLRRQGFANILGSDLKHADIHHFQELPPQLLLHFYLLGDGFLDLLVGWLVFEERLYHGCGISSQQGLQNLKFLQKVHWTSTSTLQARLYSLRAILYPHLIKLKCFNQRRCFRRLEPCWYHQTFKWVDLVQRLQANVVSIQSCRNEAIWVKNKIKMCEIVCWPHLNGENWVLNRVPEDAFGIGKGLDHCFHWSQSFHG
mmetsp:Transcript_87057/g.177870  ORF Transcript_87057/g.177870 Transcript_87057/m.177870 type:complete len:311 (+) Transcript_87057:901-1833(+)